MADRRWVTLRLAPADFGVLVAYVTTLCIFVPLHEPWADEAQAWLLSRDLSLYSLLFRDLRHEGHPALWYLLLWGPAHLHVSYSFLNWFSAAIASSGIYVLLRFAPFPFYLRAMLPFTFFLGYQYSVVARSYVLFPVLGFLIAHAYRLKVPRPLLMAVLLGLLANVSIHGTIVAVVFAALYAWKLREQNSETGSPAARDVRSALGIFTGSVLFVAICLWPTAGSLPRLSPTLNRWIDRISVPVSFGDFHQAPVPAQTSPTGTSFAQAAPVNATSVGVVHAKGRLANVPVVLSFAFASSWIVALIFDGLVVVYLFRRGLMKLALPSVVLGIFLVFVYGAPWHLGLLWITAIMALWTAWDTAIGQRVFDLQNAVGLSLGLLCALQLSWTFHAFRFDALKATSPDEATAAYLKTSQSGSRIAGFGMAVGVQPYFQHNIFFNQRRTYTYFAPDSSVLTVSQVTAQHPDIIVADEFISPLVEKDGYHLANTFCGALYFPNVPLQASCLNILVPHSPEIP